MGVGDIGRDRGGGGGALIRGRLILGLLLRGTMWFSDMNFFP